MDFTRSSPFRFLFSLLISCRGGLFHRMPSGSCESKFSEARVQVLPCFKGLLDMGNLGKVIQLRRGSGARGGGWCGLTVLVIKLEVAPMNSVKAILTQFAADVHRVQTPIKGGREEGRGRERSKEKGGQERWEGGRGRPTQYRCPFWLFWSKNRWVPLVYLVVFSHLPGKPEHFAWMLGLQLFANSRVFR